MFLSDKAIQSDVEDQLNRIGFAHRLAEAIKNWKKDDSIVIGIFGPWGSGKSSVLNITIRHLIELTNDYETVKKPIIIWFNPWNISDKEQLLHIFFQQVLSEIRKVDPKRSEDFKKGLENLGKALGAFESLPGIGQYLKIGGNAIGLFVNEKSINEEKKNLDKLFKNLDRRIVIIMDDIDRLTDEEIRLLFQMIKINADFPNTIYLVAFDRNVVERALTNDHGVKGREYLEKIVQVGFNLPRADWALIERFLSSELDKLLVDIDQKDFDTDRWASLYNHGFKDLFKSIRDVKRYINCLGMTLESMHHEVNPIDFIGLEALRVFLPNVYQGIAENKSLFLQESSTWGQRDKTLEDTRKTLDRIFTANGEEYAKIAKDISFQLFPQLNGVYTNSSYGSDWRREWREEKRICTGKFFDTYFIFGIPTGEVSQVELDQIISLSSYPERLQEAFDSYIRDNRIRRLINGLRDRTNGLERNQYNNLIVALCMLISTMQDMHVHNELLDFGSDLEILFLILDLFSKLDSNERFAWFQDKIKNGAPLYASVRIVSYDLSRENKHQQDTLFTVDQLDVLKQLCVERIEIQAANGYILSEKGFPFILYRWKEWTKNEDAIRKFMNWVRSSPITFLNFLKGFIHEERSQSSDSYHVDIKKRMNLEGLSILLTKDEIQISLEMVSKADSINLSPEQRETIDLLVASLNIDPQNTMY